MIVMGFTEGDPPLALPPVRTFERFLARAAAAIPLPGTVSVLLTSDDEVRRLNRRFRGKNKATDVLSFPAATPEHGDDGIAGDLAISVDMAARQALRLEHTLATEIKVLMLHGLLHLAGLDHESDAGEMATRELELRHALRLPGGLIERTQVPVAGAKKRAPRVSPLGAASKAVTIKTKKKKRGTGA